MTPEHLFEKTTFTWRL